MQNKSKSQKEPNERSFSEMSGEEVSMIFFGESGSEMQKEAESEKLKPARGCLAGSILSICLIALASVGAIKAYKIINPRAEPQAAQEAESANALESKLLLPSVPVAFNDISFIIDPGHGGVKGENVGTTILGYNIPERDYALGISKELAGLLDAMGYNPTIMTREANEPGLRLADRLAMFEKDAKNIGISIHVNGCDNSNARGAVVYYNSTGEEIAGYIAKSLKPIFGSASACSSDGFRVLKGKNPAVLVELGFGGSNADDARILVDKKEEIVVALAGALSRYHKEKSR